MNDIVLSFRSERTGSSRQFIYHQSGYQDLNNKDMEMILADILRSVPLAPRVLQQDDIPGSELVSGTVAGLNLQRTRKDDYELSGRDRMPVSSPSRPGRTEAIPGRRFGERARRSGRRGIAGTPASLHNLKM